MSSVKYNNDGVRKMVVFKVRELMESKDISRYRLQQITNWNYKRINSFFFGRVKQISVAEIEKLCDILECDISDMIILKK